MTANAMAGDREKVIEAGMADHIAKPLNLEEMFTTLVKWIKPGGGGVGPGGTAPVAVTGGEQSPAKAGPSTVARGNLPHLPGIDVKAGMATTMNKEELYTRILIKFRESQGKFAELFAAARTDPDPTAATRCAHTLKGTAGNIGARGVQEAAAALEHACKEGLPDGELDALLEKTLAELEPVIAGLRNVDTRATVTAAKPLAMSPDELSSTLRKLKALLDDSDTEAGEFLNELLQKVDGTPLALALQPVAKAVEAFDYDAALEKLKDVASG
jgi:HPt (histidine-containing phosphotransfer) domain-containing protein